ncbi:GUN4 domain-containing protein [Phormidesmis priestleyi]
MIKPCGTIGKRFNILKQLVAQQPEMTLPDVIMQKHLPHLSPDLHLAADWAKEKLKAGEMVVLLDLDEVSESVRPVVTKWLKRELALYPKAIAILTSRPKAYTEQPPASRLEMRMTIWVEPFTKSQQQAFIDRWYGYQEVYANNGRTTSDVTRRAADKAAGLMAQIRARPEIEDLAKIPLLLNMIATFHRLSPNVQLPKRKVDLYQAICKLQLCDRPGAKELETLLTETDAQTILQKLALEMLLNKREKTIERDALLTRLATYLETENESVKALPFLDEVVRVSELLVEREVQEYEFAHWSFQEYLAAKELFDHKREQEIIDRLAVPEWKPMILMYVGLLKNPSSLIRLMVDRGLTDLAAACLHETTKQVDADVVEELDRLTTVVTISIYAKLEALLKAGEWQEADQETYRLMIKAVGKEEGQWFSREDLENFPCEDLLTIDRLWVEASNGHFGFSVQKKIWQECGSPMNSGEDWDRFCVKAGWQNSDATAYVDYIALKFSPHLSLLGELPACGGGGMRVWSSLLSRRDL